MSRSTTVWQLLFVATYACLADRAIAQQAPAHSDVVIKNAIVMTATHGNLKNGSVYIKDGKISAVGVSVDAPASATVIDAGGKYLTPGIVDSHSHLALDDDVNEATSPITPQMMMQDAFDYQDKAIYRALAGGVTTSLLLHGSANMIGGQAVVIKHKYGAGRDAMLFPNAPVPSNLPAAKIPSASTVPATNCPPPAWAILPCSGRRWCRRRTTSAPGMSTTPR
jgi:imidazolonepropionase-like amidohydrolase